MLASLCARDDMTKSKVKTAPALAGLAKFALAFLAAFAPACASAQPTGGLLRVCADPQNMPFSNEKGDGFENKLAELIADKLGLKVQYVWLPQVVGHVATLPDDSECDILMGYAQGTGLVEDTNPYYRTSYELLYRQDDKSLAGVESLVSEPRLTSHRDLTPEARAAAGIPDGFLRLSCGLEDGEDIIEDLRQALGKE